MAQTTRPSTIRAVLMYSLPKGRLVRAYWKFSKYGTSGKKVGGMRTLSDMDLRAVRIIHTKGKIIITEPMIRQA